MDTLINDVRFALRSLRKAPTYAAIAILTMAFGIGASTAVFSMVEGVLLRPLPFAANQRLIRVFQPSATSPDARFSVLEVADYRAQASQLAAVAEYHSMPFQLYGRGDPQRVQTGVVSDNFFSLLGVKPILGRAFLPGEDAVGAPAVVVLSYRYWVEQLGADPKVIGQTFTMNDHIHTIVGVLPPLPAYPDANDLWMPAGACPFRSAPAAMANRRGRLLQMFAAMRPGVAIESAERSLDLVSSRLHAEYPEAYPDARKLHVDAHTLHSELTAQSRPLLLTLLAMAAFVLLVAAANFANLLLSRQLVRSKELALRAALGASQRRLFRQLATESLCVTMIGGAIGIGMAYASLGLLRSLATRVSPRGDEISIDPAVLGFAIVVSVVVGLVAALVPLLKRRVSLIDALRQGATTAIPLRSSGRTRGALVLMQVAVACVVLVGAALMGRSLLKLQAAPGGYDTRNVMTARVDLNWSRYTSPALTNDFADRLLGELRAVPGVTSAAITSDFPLNNALPASRPFLIRGVDNTPEKAQAQTSNLTSVGTDYFKTTGVSLLRGRAFTDADRDTSNVPAVISQRLATTFFDGRDPLGQYISVDGGVHWATVVGIVGDVRMNGLASDVSDQIYLPFAVAPLRDMRLLVRTQGDPSSIAPAIRRIVHQLDDKQPVTSVQTLEQLRGTRLAEPRVTTVLLVFFGVIALAITAAGLIGVVGQSVSQRLTEIGIRVALGATPDQVLWTVLRSALAIIAVGIVLGLTVAIFASRLIRTLLFQMTPSDPATYAVVGIALFAIAVLACLLPARRALRIQPVEALRAR